MEVVRSKSEIYLSQRKYILDFFEETDMLGCSTEPTSSIYPKKRKKSRKEGELVEDDFDDS